MPGGHGGVGADVDEGAADPHADGAQHQQVGPFTRQRMAVADEAWPDEGQQEERHQEPAAQRQGVGAAERARQGVALTGFEGRELHASPVGINTKPPCLFGRGEGCC